MGSITLLLAFLVVFPWTVENVGVIVPLYTFPWDISWQLVKSGHKDAPQVPIMIINGGNTETFDPYQYNALHEMKIAGVGFLAYVWTDSGSVPLENMTQYILRSKEWYGADGIFFDGMPNQEPGKDYYRSLSSLCKVNGLLSFANPGTPVPKDFGWIMDGICVSEGLEYPKKQVLNLPYGQNIAIAYNVSLEERVLRNIWTELGWIFLRDNYSLDFPTASFWHDELQMFSLLNDCAKSGA